MFTSKYSFFRETILTLANVIVRKLVRGCIKLTLSEQTQNIIVSSTPFFTCPKNISETN